MVKAMNDLYLFCFKDQDLLVKKINNRINIPLLSDLNVHFNKNELLPLNEKLNSKDCYTTHVDNEIKVFPDFEFISLRYLHDKITSQEFFLAGKGMSLIEWNNCNKFCGKCGNLIIDKTDETAKHCTICNLDFYPRISPAIIVAIVKDNKILLAHSKKFFADWYSVLAGFVDIGETLEETVKREIKEEVNIEVKNIRYFGSQPWPFSHSLMIGFTAEYASGEIEVDGIEIDKAGWFGVNELPPVPGKISIARHLIDWFVNKYQ